MPRTHKMQLNRPLPRARIDIGEDSGEELNEEEYYRETNGGNVEDYDEQDNPEGVEEDEEEEEQDANELREEDGEEDCEGEEGEEGDEMPEDVQASWHTKEKRFKRIHDRIRSDWMNYKEEAGTIVPLSELADKTTYGHARLNRYHYNLTPIEKSNRLFTMATRKPVMPMIRKALVPRMKKDWLSKRKYEWVPCDPTPDHPEFYIFDGNHRTNLYREFINGECYVSVKDPDDNCVYYMFVNQDACDAAVAERGFHADYTCPISDFMRKNLNNCQVSFIDIDSKISDADAYERARIANTCQPLQFSHAVKCLCANEASAFAQLLKEVSDAGDDTLERRSVHRMLRDDLFTCNISVLKLVLTHGFEIDYYPFVVKTKSMSKLLDHVDDNISVHNRRIIVNAKKRTMDTLSDILDEKKLRETNSNKATVGYFYMALFLAQLNISHGFSPKNWATYSHVKDTLEMYLKLKSSERGDNHKRLYRCFTAGIFPAKSATMVAHPSQSSIQAGIAKPKPKPRPRKNKNMNKNKAPPANSSTAA